MQWYLMNDVQISTLGRKYAGELVDDSVQSLTPIQAAGGVLLPATNPTIAAAAAILAARKRKVVLVEHPGPSCESPLADWVPREFWQLPGVRETRTYTVLEEVKNSTHLKLG